MNRRSAEDTEEKRWKEFKRSPLALAKPSLLGRLLHPIWENSLFAHLEFE
ncbi:hypothetical protein ACWATR_11370 [Nostoc sp. UIC 10890]